MAFFALDLGKTVTAVATDKAVALLRGEAALAHRAAMVGVHIVKQARHEVKPAAEVRGSTWGLVHLAAHSEQQQANPEAFLNG